MRPDGYPDPSYKHPYLYPYRNPVANRHVHLDGNGNVYEHSHAPADEHLDSTDYDASPELRAPDSRKPDHHVPRGL